MSPVFKAMGKKSKEYMLYYSTEIKYILMEKLFWKILSHRKLVKKCLAHQTSNELPLLVYFQNDSRHKSVQFYEVNKEKLWPQA